MTVLSPERGATSTSPAFHDTVLQAFHTFGEHFQLLQADTPSLLEQVFRLRHQIYCVEKGYEPPADDQQRQEQDAWDGHAKHLILLHRDSGVAVATARLILSHGHRGEGLFPAELHAGVDPRDLHRRDLMLPRERLGEVSRFAISKLVRSRLMHCCPLPGNANSHRTLGAWVTLNLIRGLVELSRDLGVDHWYTLMEAGFLRLFSRLGLFFEPVGEAIEFKGRRYLSLESVELLMQRMQDAQPALFSALWGSSDRESAGSLVAGA